MQMAVQKYIAGPAKVLLTVVIGFDDGNAMVWVKITLHRAQIFNAVSYFYCNACLRSLRIDFVVCVGHGD
jgi:hypothetical protein